MKKSYVFAGASRRAMAMFLEPMTTDYRDFCELRGLYDINIGRARTVGKMFDVPVFEDFETMIKATKPECVIVTTVDAFHSDYIIKAMELGCDVITEKPMTIDATRCNAILEAEKRTGCHVTVTFNYRYAAYMRRIKELLMDGAVGDVFSVHFEWLLDRNMDVLAHGTSYFRRWNARMKNSGGLLVHKSTHHFDLVNWWIGQKPVSVSAFAKLNLYGLPGREKYAGGMHGENCRTCRYTKECPFYYPLPDLEKELYADNQQYDGYNRDGCVYADDIDIYDTMAVTVAYDGGAVLSYSLNATAAYEGWRLVINGSNGRLEAFFPETGPCFDPDKDVIKVFDLDNKVTEYVVKKGMGGHGGGDNALHKNVFIGGQPDPLGLCAGTKDGANSIIIGAAANISIKEHRMVDISELLKEQ